MSPVKGNVPITGAREKMAGLAHAAMVSFALKTKTVPILAVDALTDLLRAIGMAVCLAAMERIVSIRTLHVQMAPNARSEMELFLSHKWRFDVEFH